MKRREFLTAAGAATASAAVASPAIAQSLPDLRWRMTSSFPKSLDVIYGGAEVFAKSVSDATDGHFKIQVFAPGDIVPGMQALDAVTSGTVEMCHTAAYYFVNKDPVFALATGVPFSLNSRMQNAWHYSGGGMDMLNAFFKDHKLYAIPCGNSGCQMGGWFRKQINEPSDLEGLKMRVGGFAGQVLSKLGVVTQQLAASEIYGALEKGRLDACEWVGPHDDEKLGLQKVAQYYYYPGWWEGGAMLHNFINLEKWNALPPAYKTVVRNASDTANLWMQAKYDTLNPPALKRLVAAGAQLKPFPPAVLDACLGASFALYREVSAANAPFKKIWDSMLAYRNDAYLWWQVAEYTYDSYLIRNRTRI